MGKDDYQTGVILVVLAAIFWSCMGLAIRMVPDAGTWAIMFWRSLGTVVILGLFVTWRSGGHLWAAVRGVGIAGVIGGLGLVAAYGGAIYAIQATTIANAVFLFAASPLLTALLGWLLLREPVRRGTWAAIGIAGIGMLIMVREGLSTGALAGNLAALGSALGFAAFTVTLRWGRLSQMLPAVILGGLFSMAFAGIVIWINGQSLMLPPRDLAITLAMGVVLLGLGMTFYTMGSRSVPAAELALLSMVEVMLAPLWVWLLLGETASATTFLGGGVVLLAIVLNALSGIRRRSARIA